MKALDTNVLARFLLNDDPVQSQIARQQLTEQCFVSETVLLELSWLLTSRYQMPREEVLANVRDLFLLPTLTIHNADHVSWAVDRFEAGAGLADMLHVATAGLSDVFVTFDRGLARRAGPNTPVPVERLG